MSWLVALLYFECICASIITFKRTTARLPFGCELVFTYEGTLFRRLSFFNCPDLSSEGSPKYMFPEYSVYSYNIGYSERDCDRKRERGRGMIGSYLLVLFSDGGNSINVGRLGEIDLEKGYYVYVGSAFGKNISIEKRLARHKKLAQRKIGRLRWHIDHLLANNHVSLRETLLVEANRNMECLISRRLEDIADDVVPRFGSSDCKCGCKGHLYYFRRKPLTQTTKMGIKYTHF